MPLPSEELPKVNSEIETAWKQAVSDPYPTESELLRTVYKEVRK